MKTTLQLVCAVLALVVRYGEGFPVEEWDAWKLRYNKHYTSPTEETEHREIWLQHYNVFTQHMADTDRSYDMEINEFADQILPRTNLNTIQLLAKDGESFANDDPVLHAPVTWDWRDKGAVTPVRNQGMMGDELAIVASESMESLHFIINGTLINLSITEMHECCTNHTVYSAAIFDCVHRIGGQCATQNYPLGPPHICKSNFCPPSIKIQGGMQSPAGDEAQLKERVYKQPVMVGIDASHASFRLYQSGIYTEPNCKRDMLDHAMQLVGYGSMNGKYYWICRNSYGMNWGMQGYILIARNQGNMCGIASNAIYPVYEGQPLTSGAGVVG